MYLCVKRFHVNDECLITVVDEQDVRHFFVFYDPFPLCITTIETRKEPNALLLIQETEVNHLRFKKL